jgi:methylenetetrahydrofolate dehydrogenase (NADP+)/methenyltetrahydrofolate cyclohydrolase
VTLSHSRTADLGAEVARADVVVAAVGKAEMIRGEWIKPGATVIDVGINRNAAGKLVGDVEFAKAAERARAITPVPGGVGPMTIAYLLSNTIQAAKAQLGLR